jgi:hypothetical protein
MFILYSLSIFALYQSVQMDDSDYDYDDNDPGEFNLIDTI